jgi:hypothetical protein
MARTIFVYTRDEFGTPIFFRSSNRAHFVRGPVADNSTRPVYFTGGPAPRPSYTMLPFSLAGVGDRPSEFFTLGLPRPDMSATPVDSSSTETHTVSVRPALYKQGGKVTYSAKANAAYTWPIGAISPNGLDDVLVYINLGILHQHQSGSEAFDDGDPLSITISLLVDTEVVDSRVISSDQSFGDQASSRLMAFAGSLRVPAALGTKNYALKFESAGSGFTMSEIDRSIYMLDIGVFHENTTIEVDQDMRFLSPGDNVQVSGVGASFTSQSTNYVNGTGFFPALSEIAEFMSGYALGSGGRAAEQTVQTINGSKEIIRTTANTIVVRGAWPWDVSSGAGGTISFDGLEDVGDVSSVQSVGYVVTFLTTIGNQVQEGPPSAMSSLIQTRPGLPVQIAGLPTGTNEEGSFRFSGKRLYRSNVTTDEIGVLQFVAELPIEQTEYVDTVRAVDLGEQLQTDTWIMPPSDLHGLVACHNGMLAGISGNQVCVSVPFQPHAWPTRSRFNIGDQPVALVAVGETIIVLTKGRPSVIYGFEPESMRVVPGDMPFPCVSADGAVSIGDAAVYPSTIGLVAIPARGAPIVVTEKIMEKEEWALYNPSTIIAAEHYGKYLGFYTNGDEKKAFLLDPTSKISALTDLDIEAVACCTDELNGQAIFMIDDDDEEIRRFDPATGDPMPLVWRSKVFSYQRPWCPSYGRVVAELYPVNYKLYANKQQPGSVSGDGTSEANMVLVHEQTVTSSRPFALPGNYLANAFSIEISTHFAVVE